MLTQKAKYALRALLHIAAATGQSPVGQSPAEHPTVAEIARERAIPHKFLETILIELRDGGFLVSRRGRKGGYRLADAADRIAIGAVIRAVDGPLAPLHCASLTAYRRCEDCEDEASCAIRHVMRQVRDATARILDETTLADLVQRSQAGLSAQDYVI